MDVAVEIDSRFEVQLGAAHQHLGGLGAAQRRSHVAPLAETLVGERGQARIVDRGRFGRRRERIAGSRTGLSSSLPTAMPIAIASCARACWNATSVSRSADCDRASLACTRASSTAGKLPAAIVDG